MYVEVCTRPSIKYTINYLMKHTAGGNLTAASPAHESASDNQD